MPETSPPVNVFTAAKSTSTFHKRVLWTVSEADARRLCGDPRTRGRNSALFWTPVDGPPAVRTRDTTRTWLYVTDDDRYAGLLTELAVTVLGSKASPYTPPAP